MIALLLAVQAGLGSVTDSLSRITLAEALQRAVRLDPGYVQAVGAVDNAAWARRAAITTMVLPSLTASTDYTAYTIDQFNVGTGAPARTLASMRLDARFELFTGGRKLAELARTAAEDEGAEANQLQQRFRAALNTEADYYAVLSNRELVDVARDRLRRAQEGFTVARARVVSGAAVQTDSLQLILELDRARIDLLLAESRLRVARLRLGGRVGLPGPVDAVPLDTVPAAGLPMSLAEAIALALEQGPEYRVARASERAADASLRAQRGSYLPLAVVTANTVGFGDDPFTRGLSRSTLTFNVSFPIWNNAQRELSFSRTRTARDLARATREELERSVEADVTAAYEAYETARATTEVSAHGLLVAREAY